MFAMVNFISMKLIENMFSYPNEYLEFDEEKIKSKTAEVFNKDTKKIKIMIDKIIKLGEDLENNDIECDNIVYKKVRFSKTFLENNKLYWSFNPKIKHTYQIIREYYISNR